MFKDKTLLITGGTGSFGNAVLERFLDTDIGEIRIFSRDEKKQDDMRHTFHNDKIKYYIGDVRDLASIKNAMHGVDYVFQAAALKQVPSCEFFPLEAVKTNVIGTDHVLTACIEAGVKKVICLSTDKAAYPVNSMGTSKAMMEKVFVAKSRTVDPEKTLICGTRYGNVMCSRGSVILLFIEQIKAGIPLTITDPHMTRFIMSLEEAVELVLFAFHHAESGDILVQKAPACTIAVLAQALKELFEADNEIREIGIRHGEKMYETLLTKEECAHAIDMGNFYRVPADKRDLNYDKYFNQGNQEVNKLSEFNSNSTNLLTVSEVKDKLLSLKYIRSELKARGESSMNILVTGANGFIGKNLIAQLNNQQQGNVFEYDMDTEPALLDIYAKECDFVFHLAGVNRPQKEEEYMTGNYGFTVTLLETLKKYHNICPVMIASSVQAAWDNPYGLSKKAGEDLLFSYAKETGAKVLVYRFPNVFGKWCKPNYNSVVATFCYNLARDLPIQVKDSNIVMNFAYIDDVVEELWNALDGKENREDQYCTIPLVYTISLGKIVNLIESFRENRTTLNISNMENEFERKLYSTYLSYLPTDQFSYPLNMQEDQRGSFTEIIRTTDRGQFAINITKTGITKGNHWHHTKNEKFLVVSGIGLIQLRRIDTEDIIEYHVSGEQMEVVDIPPGYTHNLINVGDTDLITFIWANEAFHPERPDTYFLKV